MSPNTLASEEDTNPISMMVENFLTSPDSSVKYVTFKEEPTKTRQRVQRIAQRAVKPQMFATGGERCPVVLFEDMISTHPPELKLHGLFHLTTIPRPKGEVWFSRQRMGEHKRIGHELWFNSCHWQENYQPFKQKDMCTKARECWCVLGQNH